jgi:hypothetical protein
MIDLKNYEHQYKEIANGMWQKLAQAAINHNYIATKTWLNRLEALIEKNNKLESYYNVPELLKRDLELALFDLNREE